jgi:hypothetical protein
LSACAAWQRQAIFLVEPHDGTWFVRDTAVVSLDEKAWRIRAIEQRRGHRIESEPGREAGHVRLVHRKMRVPAMRQLQDVRARGFPTRDPELPVDEGNRQLVLSTGERQPRRRPLHEQGDHLVIGDERA